MYKLVLEETLSEGVKRAILKLTDNSIEQLDRSPDNLSSVVHEVRKNFKKIRALLKLIRYSIDNEIYKKENYFFRDLGRILSPARDADVNVETLAKLTGRYKNLEQAGLNKLNEYFEQQSYHKKLYGLKTKNVPNVIKKSLIEFRGRDLPWADLPHRFSTISGGLEKVYSKGQKKAAKAYKQNNGEHFHEWRKEAKYLRYHLDFLSVLWPDMMQATENALHDLTDLLGLDHDLEVLFEQIKIALAKENPDIDCEVWQTSIQAWQEELRQKALALNIRLYNETRGQFISRLQAYWDSFYDI